MASWQYAFFFPASNQQLHPEAGISILASLDLRVDPVARRCVPSDSQNHMLDCGEEISLKVPLFGDIEDRLESGEQFSIECRNPDFMLVAFFAHRTNNAHVFFGWPRKFVDNLTDEKALKFWKLIRKFASESNAAYVIIVDDAADHFEDRFLEIDGQRYLDLVTNHKYGHGICAIWVRKGTSVPEGFAKSKPVDIGDDFARYSVVT